MVIITGGLISIKGIQLFLKVIFGSLPHEIYPYEYSVEDYFVISKESSNNYFREINFDNIFVKDKEFSSETVGLHIESNL